ncbi:MAG: hypothetical protein J6X05_00010 [Bacteroidales bacterium]|nr:hypothetical protein [Bacteroidales bacterium]
MSMDLHRKDFWKALGRVFLVNLSCLLLCVLLWSFRIDASFYVIFYLVLSIFLIIYSLIEACKAFKQRASIRDENVTREDDYFFAVLRFVAILIPLAAAGACLGFLWIIAFWGATGYHG